MTGLFTEKRSQLTEGRWPVEPDGTPGAALEAAIEVSGAELVGLAVGDELDIAPASGVLEDKTPPGSDCRLVPPGQSRR